jgi:hypothetical protein
VPLNAVHHLRETLNSVPEGQDIPEDALEKYDAPVMAAAVKLWLLELEPPLGLYEAWDEFRKIYPSSKSTYRMEIHGFLTLSALSRCKDRTITGATFRGCGCGIAEIPQGPSVGIGCRPPTPQVVRAQCLSPNNRSSPPSTALSTTPRRKKARSCTSLSWLWLSEEAS